MTPTRRGRRSRPLLVALLLVSVALATATWSLGRDATPVPSPSAPELDALIDELLADLSSRDGSYRSPTASQRIVVASAAAAAGSGDIQRARRLAEEIGYEVLIAVADGEPAVVLRERDAGGRGWGLFVFGTGDRSAVLVEVPHPIADLQTAEIGLGLFIETRASALLIAGAHRDAAPAGSADVAHRRDTVFHAVHEHLLDEDVLVVQPHGFASSDDRPFEAVVSAGTRTPTAVATDVGEVIASGGARVCLYGEEKCDDLGGTSNQQGITARRLGAFFLHLEFDPALRAPGAPRKRLIGDLAAALRRLS